MEGYIMQKKRSRYQAMERHMTYTILADLTLFLLYMIFAMAGIVWLKVIIAIIAILISGLCLVYLYLTREILRKRSLWMSAAAAAITLCLLASLILNIPSPNPYRQAKSETETTQQIPE